MHNRDAEEACADCAKAWKAQHGTPYWRTTARCPHVTPPQSGHRKQDAMATTLVDVNDPERVLVGTCEQCRTSLPAKRARR